MNLKDQITEALKIAMRSKQVDRVEALRFLLAQIKNKEISLRPRSITHADILSVLQKQAKQRKDGIEQFRAAQRPDLVEKEQKELAILKEFLPTPLNEAELAQVIKDVILSLKKESSDKSLMGQVIKTVMAQTQGRADSQTISRIVKAQLQSL